MPLVRFTKMLEETFGGCYRTKTYNVRKVGAVMDLSDGEISRLNHSHPGLVEPVTAEEVKAETERDAEEAGAEKTEDGEAEEEDEETDKAEPVRKEITGGQDKEIRGKQRKARRPRKKSGAKG